MRTERGYLKTIILCASLRPLCLMWVYSLRSLPLCDKLFLLYGGSILLRKDVLVIV
ncbi:MAG: hypothetical protein H6Q68_1867 [Firmicutes bacterium]|nr:hypothetical protein [Bacillota bacterium]